VRYQTSMGLLNRLSARSRRLSLAGPPGLRERLAQAMEVLFPGSSAAARKFKVDASELAEGVATVFGPLRVTPFQVVHACGAPPYALRIELGGRVVTYSGDTEWTDRLIPAAAGADLFLCEAYFYEKRVPFHLDYVTLARRRAELGCKRLVVTHMSDDMLARLGELDVEAATDGLEILL
jgi:ribonuclease BN (tRNA processing enzyme)